MAVSTAVPPKEVQELIAAGEELKKVTPQDYLDMTNYTNGLESEVQRLKAELAAKNQVQVFPAREHRSHAWTKFTHPGEREEISMGTKGDTMQEVIDDFMAGVEYARSKGLVIVGINTIKPLPSGALQPATGEGTKPYQSSTGDVPDLPAGGPVGETLPEQPYIVGKEPYVKDMVYQFVCVKLKITQEANGRARVEFFTNAHKQPVDDFVFVTAIDTPANLAKKFAAVGPWEEKHFQVPYDKILQVPFNVDWVYSEKVNSKGNHYRNLVGLEPIV